MYGEDIWVGQWMLVVVVIGIVGEFVIQMQVVCVGNVFFGKCFGIGVGIVQVEMVIEDMVVVVLVQGFGRNQGYCVSLI